MSLVRRQSYYNSSEKISDQELLKLINVFTNEFNECLDHRLRDAIFDRNSHKLHKRSANFSNLSEDQTKVVLDFAPSLRHNITAFRVMTGLTREE